MRFYRFLNEAKNKKLWQMTFEEFSNNADISWDDEENVYIFKYKEGKKIREVRIPQNNYQDALWQSYVFIIKQFKEQANLDILQQFKGNKWADEEIEKRNNPLKYIEKTDLISNKDLREYVKSTKEYKDYLDFWKNLAKKAEKQETFTWNDVKAVASKSGIEIRSGSLLNKTAYGEADPGGKSMSIKKDLIGTSKGIATFFHELTHLLLVTKSGDEPWSSVKKTSITNTEWIEVFNVLDDSRKGRSRTSQTERYARLFEAFFTENKKLRKQAPNLYKKVYSLLEDIAIYLVVKNHGGYLYFKDLIRKKTE